MQTLRLEQIFYTRNDLAALLEDDRGVTYLHRAGVLDLNGLPGGSNATLYRGGRVSIAQKIQKHPNKPKVLDCLLQTERRSVDKRPIKRCEAW